MIYLGVVIGWLFVRALRMVMAPGGNRGGDEPNYPQYGSDATTQIAGTGFKVSGNLHITNNLQVDGGGGSVINGAVFTPVIDSVVSNGSVVVGGGRANFVRVAPNGSGSLRLPILGSTKVNLAGTNQTLSAAQMMSGTIVHAPTGAATDTTDVPPNINAAKGGAVTGDTIAFYLINNSAFVITIAAGISITMIGSTSLPAGKVALIVMHDNGDSTYDQYNFISA